MPIGGERPDPPKGKVKNKEVKNDKKVVKSFFKVNWDIFIIFILIIIGSNFHKIFPNMGVSGEWYVYLFCQQLFGASVIFTFLYWKSINVKFIFKKSLALGILVLSLLSAAGEGLKVYGNSSLDQANKGWVLLAEYSFILGIIVFGYLFYKHKSGE